tara:strand:- start:27 stop:599 length:573 start_codon:yes stop_codon:yes gene_type:complete
MFCPSCSGLAYPRKGVAGNIYKRLHAVKKDKAVFEKELVAHEKLIPMPENFDGINKWQEFDNANVLWASEKPGEFNKSPRGDEVEMKGKDYIMCENGRCGFHGPADGVDKDLLNAMSSTKAEGRKYDVIKDSDKRHGVLTTDSYMCPNRIDGTPCDCIEVYSELVQTRSSDEPETRMLTCKECGHGWREY